MEKNELRNACQVIQMQLDYSKEFSQSEYWKYISFIIRSITPNVDNYTEVVPYDKKR